MITINKNGIITILKFILAPLIVVGLCVAYFIYINTAKTTSFFSMDTFVSITTTDKKLDKYVDIVNQLDSELDMYDENSMIYDINSNGRSENISPYVADIIRKSIDLSDKYGFSVDITSGALTELWGITTDNPRVPSDEEIAKALSTIDVDKIKVTDTSIILPEGTKLDLGCVAKGYACDVIKENFQKNGVGYGLFSMGSSSLIYGQKISSEPFTVEIKNPDGGEPLGIISTNETFVSTSGGYERYFEADGKKYPHILDLSTGYPSESDLKSVTVLCDKGIDADFLSTMIYLEGSEGIKRHLNSEDYSVVIATNDNKIYWSEKLMFYFNSESGFVKGE